MQCNGKEPFDRAGVRQFHPKPVPEFPEALWRKESFSSGVRFSFKLQFKQ
jgi:hypothetical protein